MTLRVTLVGAGIVGAAVADELARAGARVTLVDAGVPGRGTSATSLSWFNANNQPRPYFDFRVAAMRAWTELAAEFGEPAWYQPSGNLDWAIDPDDKAELHERVERLCDRGYPAALVTPSRASELEPRLRIPIDTAIAHVPSEGWVDGAGAVDALIDRAQAQRRHRGRQRPCRCDRYTSRRPGGHGPAGLGRRRGQRRDGVLRRMAKRRDRPTRRRRTAARRRCRRRLPSTLRRRDDRTGSRSTARLVHGADLHLRPTADGGVWLEASDVNATVDQATTDSQLQAAADVLLDRARAVLPALGDMGLLSARRCIRPLPDDGLPIVGRHPLAEGLYVVVTHSGITSPLTSAASSPRTSSTATLPPLARQARPIHVVGAMTARCALRLDTENRPRSTAVVRAGR